MNEELARRTVEQQFQRYDARARAWIERFTQRGGQLHCAAGCFRCCDMPVRVSWPEALAISAHLSEEQHRAMSDHARRVVRNARTSRTPDAYVENHRKHVGFCPLLDPESGGCTQYAWRPARCRDTYSAMPARYCGAGALESLPARERRDYQRSVQRSSVTDGESHYVAPLEDLSLPAWEQFSRLMRRELGFEVWGDFAYLVSMTRNDAFREALTRGSRRAALGALREAGLYHQEIVQLE